MLTKHILHWGLALISAAMTVSSSIAIAGDHGEYSSRIVTISQAWVRNMPPSARMQAAYLTLSNAGTDPLTLNRVSSDAYDLVEIHQSEEVDGIYTMRQIPHLHLAPGQSVSLEPGGLHLMLMRRNRAVSLGDQLAFTFHFSNGQSVVVDIPVQ